LPGVGAVGQTHHRGSRLAGSGGGLVTQPISGPFSRLYCALAEVERDRRASAGPHLIGIEPGATSAFSRLALGLHAGLDGREGDAVSMIRSIVKSASRRWRPRWRGYVQAGSDSQCRRRGAISPGGAERAVTQDSCAWSALTPRRSSNQFAHCRGIGMSGSALSIVSVRSPGVSGCHTRFVPTLERRNTPPVALVAYLCRAASA
jgi:hypothetical protein